MNAYEFSSLLTYLPLKLSHITRKPYEILAELCIKQKANEDEYFNDSQSLDCHFRNGADNHGVVSHRIGVMPATG